MYKFDNKKIKKYLNILGKMSLKDENYREKYLNEINKIINNAKGGALLDDILNSSGFLPMSDENKMKIDWMWKHKKGLNPAPLSAKYRLNLCGIDGEKISNQIIQNNGFFLPDINSNQDWDSGGSSNICIKMYKWVREEYENDLFNLGYTINGDKYSKNENSHDPGIISYINNENQSYILGNYINSSDGIFDIDNDYNNIKKNKLLDFLKKFFNKKVEHKGGAIDDNRELLIKKELQKILSGKPVRIYDIQKTTQPTPETTLSTATPETTSATPPAPAPASVPASVPAPAPTLSFLYYYYFLYYYMLSTINTTNKVDIINVKSFFYKLFFIGNNNDSNGYFDSIKLTLTKYFFTILLLECDDNSFLFYDFLTKYINITEGEQKINNLLYNFVKLYVQLFSYIQKKNNCKNSDNFKKYEEFSNNFLENKNITYVITNTNTSLLDNKYKSADEYYKSFVKMRKKTMEDEILSVKYANANANDNIPLNKDESISKDIITYINELFYKSEKVHYGHWEETNVDYTLPDKLEILLKKDNTGKKTKHLFKAGDMYYLTDNQNEFLENNLICKKKTSCTKISSGDDTNDIKSNNIKYKLCKPVFEGSLDNNFNYALIVTSTSKKYLRGGSKNQIGGQLCSVFGSDNSYPTVYYPPKYILNSGSGSKFQVPVDLHKGGESYKDGESLLNTVKPNMGITTEKTKAEGDEKNATNKDYQEKYIKYRVEHGEYAIIKSTTNVSKQNLNQYFNKKILTAEIFKSIQDPKKDCNTLLKLNQNIIKSIKQIIQFTHTYHDIGLFIQGIINFSDKIGCLMNNDIDQKLCKPYMILFYLCSICRKPKNEENKEEDILDISSIMNGSDIDDIVVNITNKIVNSIVNPTNKKIDISDPILSGIFDKLNEELNNSLENKGCNLTDINDVKKLCTKNLKKSPGGWNRFKEKKHMSQDFFNSLLNLHFRTIIDSHISNYNEPGHKPIYKNIFCSIDKIEKWYNQNLSLHNNICNYRKVVKEGFWSKKNVDKKSSNESGLKKGVCLKYIIRYFFFKLPFVLSTDITIDNENQTFFNNSKQIDNVVEYIYTERDNPIKTKQTRGIKQNYNSQINNIQGNITKNEQEKQKKDKEYGKIANKTSDSAKKLKAESDKLKATINTKKTNIKKLETNKNKAMSNPKRCDGLTVSHTPTGTSPLLRDKFWTNPTKVGDKLKQCLINKLGLSKTKKMNITFDKTGYTKSNSKSKQTTIEFQRYIFNFPGDEIFSIDKNNKSDIDRFIDSNIPLLIFDNPMGSYLIVKTAAEIFINCAKSAKSDKTRKRCLRYFFNRVLHLDVNEQSLTKYKDTINDVFIQAGKRYKKIAENQGNATSKENMKEILKESYPKLVTDTTTKLIIDLFDRYNGFKTDHHCQTAGGKRIKRKGVKNINSDVKKFMREAKKYLRNAKKGGDDSQFDLFVAARAVQDAYNKSDSLTKKELEKTVESMNSTLSFIIEKNSKS